VRTVSPCERGWGDLRYSELREAEVPPGQALLELREAEVPPGASVKRWMGRSRTEAQKCFSQLRFLKEQPSK